MVICVRSKTIVAVGPSLGGRLGDGHELLLDVDQLVVVVPGVAPFTIGVLDHVVLGPRQVFEPAPPLALHTGPPLAVLLRQPCLPHVGGLDDVIVDADDLR